MTEQDDPYLPDSPPRAQEPGFFSRLWRALVRTVLALVIVAALAVGGWLGFRELRRSFDVVSSRIDDQAVTQIAQEQRIAELATRLVGVDDRVLAQDAVLVPLATSAASDEAGQVSAVATLQAALDALNMDAGTRDEQLTALTAAVAALQADLTSGGSDLDALGGAVDGLAGDVAALREQTAVQSADLAAFGDALAVADLDGLRQAIFLFRVWEMVSRARLRLLENNAGLAAADVARAQAMVAGLIAGETFADNAPLAQIAQRLNFAAANLPASPQAAVTDLELAWEALDRLLAEQLGLAPLPAEVTTTPTAQPAAPATTEATTTPETTPAPTGSPTPTIPPTPTPSG